MSGAKDDVSDSVIVVFRLVLSQRDTLPKSCSCLSYGRGLILDMGILLDPSLNLSADAIWRIIIRRYSCLLSHTTTDRLPLVGNEYLHMELDYCDALKPVRYG